MSYKDEFFDRLSSRWSEGDVIRFMRKHINRLDAEIKSLKERLKKLENKDENS